MKIFNCILIFFVIFFSLIFFAVDKDSLDSLIVRADDIKIQEEFVLNVDYNSVIYNDSVVYANNTPDTSAKEPTPVVNSDRWVFPVEGGYTITTYYSSSHNAIDIYSYNGYGSSIYAAHSGVVSLVMGGCVSGDLSCNGRGGNYVVINHNNGYYTVYMHLASINVSLGQSVSAGDIVGRMGNTGNVIPAPNSYSPYNGTHLHFALYVGEPYRGGYTINPLSMY